ncbi:hypothetical protein ACEI87_10080 [Clostridioides difficile]
MPISSLSIEINRNELISMNIGILLSSIVLAFSVVFIAKTIKKRWLKVIIIISLIAIATLITYFTNGYL